MQLQAEQAVVAAQRQTDSDNRLAQMIVDFESRLREQPAPQLVPQIAAAEFHEDYQRQTLTLQRSRQVVDKLTAMLERTRRTLAAVAQQAAA